MHKESTITYSTVRKTWSASVSKVAILAFIGLLVVVIVAMAGSFYMSLSLLKQRGIIKNEYATTKDLYYDAVSLTSRLESSIDYLSQEINQKNQLLKNSDIVSYMLKQKRANSLFASKEVIDYPRAPVQPTVNTDLVKAFDGVASRLDTLYHLPSGSPLINYSYISSRYGVRRHPVSSIYQFHHGIDMPLRKGDDVVTTAAGTISFVGRKVGYGVIVVIEHRFGFATKYAHLNKALVKRGDVVSKGQVIAEGGNTGISTGPHLHYEITYLDGSVDTAHFYDWNLANFDNIFSRYNKIKWQQIIAALQKDQQEREKLSSLKELN